MSCNQENSVRHEEQYEVKHVVFTSEEDDPGPPPPNFTSQFKTIEEWLFSICDSEKPKKSITTYKFGLFEGENDYTLCLTGISTKELSQTHTRTKIDFAPADMYFSVPAAEFNNLARKQVLERLTSQLKEFTTTNKFKQSFLAEAKSIVTEWNGEIVWKK